MIRNVFLPLLMVVSLMIVPEAAFSQGKIKTLQKTSVPSHSRC